MRIRAIVFALLIASCTQEDIVVKEYPRMGTTTADPNSSGVTFHANLVSQGTEPVTEHGFEWSIQPASGEPTDLNHAMLGALSSVEFSTIIDAGIEDGVQYVVRGFVQTEKYRIVAAWTSFTGKGSSPPVVTDIVPSTATWGDTIAIHGQRFSFNEEIVDVWFSATSTAYPTQIISSTDQLIKAIVPIALQDKKETQLTIKVGGESVVTNSLFKLSPQEITSISPEEVNSQSVVTIIGKNFLPYGNKVFVSTGLEMTPLAEITPLIVDNANEIQFKIPPTTPGGTHLLRVTSAALVIEVADAFTRLVPVVTSVTPSLVWYGDVVRITGSNFGENYADNKVVFDGVQGLIVGVGPGQIDVEMPSVSDFTLTLTADLMSTTVPNAVSLKDPVITSVTAGPIYPGQLFDVEGNYLSGSLFVGDVELATTFWTETKFTAVMPLVTEYSPEVRIERSGQTSNTNVTLNSPVRALKVPGHAMAYCAAFSVGSNGYIVANLERWDSPASTFWKYDQMFDQWVQLDDFPGAGRSGATAFTLDGNGYLLGGTRTNTEFANDLWKFDASTESWTQLNALPFHAIESFVMDGEAYAICDVTLGIDDTGAQIVTGGKRVWKYDSSLDAWTERATVPMDLFAGPGNRNYFTMAVGNRFFLVSYDGGPSQIIEYLTETDAWTYKTPTGFTFDNSGAPYSIQHNGVALVFDGGYRFYKYQPGIDTWTLEEEHLNNMFLGGQPAVFNIGDKTYFGLFTYNGLFVNPNRELRNLFYEFDGQRAGY